MIKIEQVIVVEGRYDKSKLAGLVDATIVTTGGFDIYRDKAKLAMLRRMADKHGLILLTDSDAAGFRIRSYIAGAIDAAKVTHVYTPDLFGKESRKRTPGAEGKLGVEGMPVQVLLDALKRAGVTVQGETTATPVGEKITTSDLMEWGLSGGDGAADKRRALLAKLGLPARLSPKGMLAAVNALYTRAELEALLREE